MWTSTAHLVILYERVATTPTIGRPHPVPQDIYLTRRLKTIADMHGIDILDHIIYSPATGALGIRTLHPEIWPS